MRGLGSRLYLFSCNFIQILSLLFTGILFISSFLFTCYADDMVTQKVLTAVDNPFFNIFFLLLFLGAVCLCCYFVCLDAKRRKPVLLAMVFCWIILLGVLLILFGKTVPAADAWSVYSAAESLAHQDTSVIHPTESYFSYYTQQVGLMAFYELLIRLWNLLPVDLHAYHFIKCLYVVFTCVIVYYQYRLVHLLWEDDRVDCIYLILAGANLPLIMYSSFVYGEIPSFAAMSLGLYYLFMLLKKDAPSRSWLFALISLPAFAIAVMLRKNSLILIIAIVLVIFMEWCKSRRHPLLIYSVLCIAFSLTILPVTQKIYELRAHNHLNDGVPAMSYFAMGMQESSRANGWYNGFNFNTYQETGMNTGLTVTISRQAIHERMEYFREHPDYATAFYFNKYLSQWADGTYASRQATLATFGGRHPFFQAVYDGAYSSLYIGYCNIYQIVIYLGSFLFFLSLLLKRQKNALYVNLGMIGAFGGFLFHMMWEANARYIFLYSLLLIPYASKSIAKISSTFSLGIFRKNKKDHRQDATEKPTTAA